MSEYQLYDFRAIDRRLTTAEQAELRAISTRARLSATSLTASYDYGEFKGDVNRLMERYFDVHLYLADWPSRRLIFRFPKSSIDRATIAGMVSENDSVEIREAGDFVIVDIRCDELDVDYRDSDGEELLDSLAPLREAVMAGDPRMFYLLWLMDVAADLIADDATEPLPGLGPLTPSLEAFAEFFAIDIDLVDAAAARPNTALPTAPTRHDARRAVEAMSHDEMVAMLARVTERDEGVFEAMRQRVIASRPAATTGHAAPPRSVAELKAGMAAAADARERARLAGIAAEERRVAAEEARQRKARVAKLRKRGAAAAWDEIEAEIARRNGSGYAAAVGLMLDLATMADEDGTPEAFTARLMGIRAGHLGKTRFIERLDAAGLVDVPPPNRRAAPMFD